MPYIPNSEREKVNKGLMTNAGCFNFAVHQLIDKYIEQNKKNYQTINDIIGALDCIKMELYRRIAAEYEDCKILQNGDCLPYEKNE